MTPHNILEEKLLKFPRDVHCLLFLGEGSWLVGSGADPAVPNPKDYDIVVPHALWLTVSQCFASMAGANGASLTRFGALRSEVLGVDLWPDDIGRVLCQPLVMHAWHPKTMTFVSKQRTS